MLMTQRSHAVQGTSGAGGEIEPFRIEIPRAAIDDLRDRLRRTRYGAELPGQGWARGVPRAWAERVVSFWAHEYDWREQERALNELAQYTTSIEGQTIHFAYVRSASPNAIPLLCLHDWPGSFVVYTKVITQLAGDFHLVIPNTPGVAFSGPLTSTGWNAPRIANAYLELMSRLGYERFGVQGQGGAGAGYATEIARQQPERVRGVHVNALLTFPSGDPADSAGLTEAEQGRLARLQHFRDDMMGFNILQSTRPHTLAFALHDSPVGQLAWIGEKFKEWTDPTSQTPEDAVGLDTLLTNVSLYWFTATAGSSANLYYEVAHDPAAYAPKPRTEVPLAALVAVNSDITIRRFAERDSNVTRWTEVACGGNFQPLEQPEVLARDVREFFAELV
jgi:pimeloyl-ACP methyl ester carboxylesterase